MGMVALLGLAAILASALVPLRHSDCTRPAPSFNRGTVGRRYGYGPMVVPARHGGQWNRLALGAPRRIRQGDGSVEPFLRRVLAGPRRCDEARLPERCEDAAVRR